MKRTLLALAAALHYGCLYLPEIGTRNNSNHGSNEASGLGEGRKYL